MRRIVSWPFHCSLSPTAWCRFVHTLSACVRVIARAHMHASIKNVCSYFDQSRSGMTCMTFLLISSPSSLPSPPPRFLLQPPKDIHQLTPLRLYCVSPPLDKDTQEVCLSVCRRPWSQRPWSQRSNIIDCLPLSRDTLAATNRKKSLRSREDIAIFLQLSKSRVIFFFPTASVLSLTSILSLPSLPPTSVNSSSLTHTHFTHPDVHARVYVDILPYLGHPLEISVSYCNISPLQMLSFT